MIVVPSTKADHLVGRSEWNGTNQLGNLTSGGWGGNRELATSWKFGPGQSDQGVWLRPLLASISAWCSGSHEKTVIERALGLGWVDSLPASSDEIQPALLFSQVNLPLATQLAARWVDEDLISLPF